MSPSFFSGSGALSKATYFDIRLDESYVVFRGNEQEAASAHLAGTLVLCLNEPLTIKHIKLSLIGMSRVSWHSSAPGPGSRRASRERTFFEQTWTFKDAGKGKTELLPVDNYEFPFDLILNGSLPESVEGLHDSWITYRFKAEIGRKYAKDLTVRKPLKIIRTLDPSALELAHAMSVENVWPDKVEYSISTPSKAVPFGTAIKIDFCLSPLLKGLKIGAITSQLIESHEFTLNPEDPNIFHSTHKYTRIIVGDTHFIGGLHGRRSCSRSRRRSTGGASRGSGGNSDDEQDASQYLEDGLPGYSFTRVLELPRTLNKCMQDTDTRGIKIKHKLKFKVQLHNPDGHTSELRATLPVSIFISPNLPIDEHHTLSLSAIRNVLPPNTSSASAADAINAALSLQQQAPPLYGEHQFDQLYEEIDTTGYQTPAVISGGVTPFGTLSRNVSVENLAGMPGTGYGTSGGMTGNISAAMLQHRLNNLNPNGSGTGSRAPFYPTSGANAESNCNLATTPGSNTPPPLSAIGTTEAIPITNVSDAASPDITLPRSPDQNIVSFAQTNQVACSCSSASIAAASALTPIYGLPRRGSEDECFSLAASGSATTNPYFAEVEDLSRVPSYQTAVRSHTRRRMSAGLPDYNEVVGQTSGPSRPPSNGQTTNVSGSGNGTSISAMATATSSSNSTSRASSGANTPITSPRPRFAAFRSSSHSALSTIGGPTSPSAGLSGNDRLSSGASTPNTASSSLNHAPAERAATSSCISNGNVPWPYSGASHARSHTWSWLHNHTHHHERYSGLLSHARHGGDHSTR
ncbi:hypothetical protein KEM54_004292 [Ascosphaera aggregata]|nr:hypothetical protein KEM54_004292 [Ascosphaera aggregata]